ncbi:hypothetical protein AADG42_04730 [Ammonicoccus fulvus]|uniref:Uncharacterized protein n=1 Tax=Ammonicoccus fulvus TaxID=3138240 RepID=A0ABZ3FKS6_9ACTN
MRGVRPGPPEGVLGGLIGGEQVHPNDLSGLDGEQVDAGHIHREIVALAGEPDGDRDEGSVDHGRAHDLESERSVADLGHAAGHRTDGPTTLVDAGEAVGAGLVPDDVVGHEAGDGGHVARDERVEIGGGDLERVQGDGHG